MARQRRRTQPLDTLQGQLTDYGEIERHLIDGEMKGRAWVFAQTKIAPRSVPDDAAICALHREMFSGLLSWAGEFRKVDVGPSGLVNVRWFEVPTEMRKFGGDLAAWVAGLPSDPSVNQLAEVMADAHHRFQWIHPFEDTNGRTGRVLDLYLLWVTFGLAGADVTTSRLIEPFPTEIEETEYYDGLAEADAYRPDRIRGYYTARILAAFDISP
jgi:fido (protein-threonine AMPylation protein)